jgi:hypothetical protein
LRTAAAVVPLITRLLHVLFLVLSVSLISVPSTIGDSSRRKCRLLRGLAAPAAAWLRRAYRHMILASSAVTSVPVLPMVRFVVVAARSVFLLSAAAAAHS